MDFIDEIKQFSKRVDSLKDNLTTEEATKTSLIMPFFALLGYDVFNPDEFVPEYTADVGIKKGEKVDYAILNNGEPVILIEAKWVKEELQKHDSQLFRYFGTSKAKFAILTNGITYRFYTDLEETNKMDEKPFLEINMLDIKETQVAELKKFKKSAFSIDEIFNTASQLKYSNEIKNVFAQDLQNPSDQLIKYFLSSVYSGQRTQNAIEKFRPIVKQSLNQFINEMMNDKIKTALGAEETQPLAAETSETAETAAPAQAKDAPKIVTTEEELEAYFIIKNLLKEVVPIEEVTYKDNERYMAILHKNKTTRWICRLYFNSAKKFITVPDENKKDVRIDIDSVYDIEKHKDKLVMALNRYL
ncbi:MAG: type I restriction endonuclease [Ruminococcus sp.]|nr:type I restriction endonuclease [Ruminococcus sp.]MCM1380388.1 type I restriction endonuclease [Muribaculaceae bacterium]MCM1478302.1 type I restriction endonuclease [Muribaculaceae bacterium]